MELAYFLQIAYAKGVGDVTIRKIIKFSHENHLSWEEICTDSVILAKLFPNKQSVIEDVYKQRNNAMFLAEQLVRKGIGIVFTYENQYPQRLRKVLGDSCPPYLFYKGNIDIASKEAVGFCGSRRVSEKGLAITRDCAGLLAKEGVTVVSGYAAGTDMAAHTTALEHGGDTIFVLAEGIMKYSIKREIKDRLSDKNHVFISRYLPGAVWNVSNAMNRNSVIIGLSDAMILVESGKTGGTFSAGNEALSLRHPLFVIDFAQPEVSAEANPYFIAKGGIPIRGKNGTPSLIGVFNAVRDHNSHSYGMGLTLEQTRLNMQ